ncbi:MAG TPA: creatininase family protein [Flavitalea sp.]|nr:creatininase family protein [Flavitalea sp.]
MKHFTTVIALLFSTIVAFCQPLHTRWDELTASEWPKALAMSDSTCILPFGILEKHGPHGPIGSDLIQVRDCSAMASKKEYAVVFPDYFYGQIYEAKQQPGTFALPPRVVWDLLDATCDEIARNGFKKIIIVNGHGGNPNLITYFAQTRLEKKRNYALYFFQPSMDSAFTRKMLAERKSDISFDQHAGEGETSRLLYLRPDVVKMDSANTESGKPQRRLHIKNAYTPIWWYADYPNHYAGEGGKATKEYGKLLVDQYVDQLAKTIKAIKADKETQALQEEFYNRMLK